MCLNCSFALYLQLEASDTDEAVQGIFDNPDHELTLLETGYRKPFLSLCLSDRTAVANTLKTHVLAKVKPELDQFAEGLSVCGVWRL